MLGIKRLQDAKGRPNFNVNFYCLAKDGRFAGASLWAGSQMAVHDGQTWVHLRLRSPRGKLLARGRYSLFVQHDLVRNALTGAPLSGPAGGSQTVELQLNSSGGPVTNLVAVASVSSVTSDVNQDNNVATATGTTNDVPLYIQGTYGPSNLNVVYTATGGSPFPGYATPNS